MHMYIQRGDNEQMTSYNLDEYVIMQIIRFVGAHNLEVWWHNPMTHDEDYMRGLIHHY